MIVEMAGKIYVNEQTAEETGFEDSGFYCMMIAECRL
jgi:hypothetical protein